MHAGSHRDLSHAHSPLSDLFPNIHEETESSRWRLSQDQLQFFEQNGFVVGPQLFAGTTLEHLRAELTMLMEPTHPGSENWYEYHTNESSDPSRILFHALGAWRIATGFHDLLWHPGFVQPAEQLLNGPIRFWHDQLFCKPAMHGGVVAWHQDYSYWTRTRPMAHLTAWIGLDNATPENGCIHYVPGSHHWDLLPITGLAGDMQAIRSVLNDEQWEQFRNPVAVPLQAGQCVFHHPLTVHGSFANRTSTPRRATVINAIRDGVCSESWEPLLQGIPAVAPGTPLAGQFFPRLSK